MDAADIMFKMAETYANCSTYQDRGLVRHFEQEDREDYRHRIGFKTNFKRPDAFYFEWAETPIGDPEVAQHRISALWTSLPTDHGKGSTGQSPAVRQAFRQFHSQSEAQICPSLDYIIAAAAGVSKGSSVTVAAYILPTLRQKMRTLFRLRELNLVCQELIDGCSCHYLKGQNWGGTDEEFWVDNETFLLKRTRVAFVIKPGVDENQLAAIKKIDPEQAEEYRKFREAQKEERRFWNQLDYHAAAIDEDIEDQAFIYDPSAKSDLISTFAVL
jgi:hypothetical protein